ncbi:MAG TPA: hypothetical protein VJ373_03880 [Desulfatiglandales bacterium]|nr:hypothetical protein [Desulfatiglandales bacterium]
MLSAIPLLTRVQKGDKKRSPRRILWIESPDLGSLFRHDRAKKEEE